MSEPARISEIAGHWYPGERAREDVRYLLARVDALTQERDSLVASLDCETKRRNEAKSERDAAVARAERMATVIADAVSVGEMQGEDFRLQPWSTLRAALAASSAEGES